MIPFFPKKIATNGLTTYIMSLSIVSVLFSTYAMPLGFAFLGLCYVILFFFLSNRLTVNWGLLPREDFTRHLFLIAILIRVLWVIFSYFYYTGVYDGFEQLRQDSLNYHQTGSALAAKRDISFVLNHFFNRTNISDSGFGLYLTILYSIFGNNILVARLFNALLSAATAVLIYRLGARQMGEKVGRMAAIFYMLCPNFIHYCGLHLKETLMIFLEIAFLERADLLLRNPKLKISTLIVTFLLLASLFLFRTVLGAVAVLSMITFIFFSEREIVKWRRRPIVIIWTVLFLIFTSGSVISSEIEMYWNQRDSNATVQRETQTKNGSLWAQYATSAVMLPMVFVLPYSTMVEVGDQEEQLFLHAGNFIKNFFGIFILIALYLILFKLKTWKSFTLTGTFLLGYLIVVGLSGFSNSERFLLPAYPLLLFFAAYGIAHLDAKTFRLSKYWCVVVVLMEIAWAFFKLGNRGLL